MKIQFRVWLIVTLGSLVGSGLGCLGGDSSVVQNASGGQEQVGVEISPNPGAPAAGFSLKAILTHPANIVVEALLGTGLIAGVGSKVAYAYSQWFKGVVDSHPGKHLWWFNRPAYNAYRDHGQDGLDAFVNHGQGGLDVFLDNGQEGLDVFVNHGQEGLDVFAAHGQPGVTVYLDNNKDLDAVDAWDRGGPEGLNVYTTHGDEGPDALQVYVDNEYDLDAVKAWEIDHDDGVQIYVDNGNDLGAVKAWDIDSDFGLDIYHNNGNDLNAVKAWKVTQDKRLGKAGAPQMRDDSVIRKPKKKEKRLSL